MWEEPKSWCFCDHLGDGINSQHNGVNGHGACNVEGCDCRQFTWKRFRKSYQQELDTQHQDQKDYDTTVQLTRSEAEVVYDLLENFLDQSKCIEPTGRDKLICTHCRLEHALALLRVGGYQL